MKAHGGGLTIDSEEGKGTTFYARLPHVKPKVLIVDDDKVIRNLLFIQLKGLDAEIIGAKNGKEALLSVQSNPPHLIITDLTMPVMDGFELISHLKKDSNTDSIPIMVITSDNDQETRQHSFKLGVQDFIQKPLVENDILQRAERLIGYM